ncbi:hypothetical protein [Thermofilum pendens]
MADYAADTQRGRAYGFTDAVTKLASIPAPATGGWLWTTSSPHTVLYATAALIAASTLPLLLTQSHTPPRKAQATPTPHPPKTLKTRRNPGKAPETRETPSPRIPDRGRELDFLFTNPTYREKPLLKMPPAKSRERSGSSWTCLRSLP